MLHPAGNRPRLGPSRHCSAPAANRRLRAHERADRKPRAGIQPDAEEQRAYVLEDDPDIAALEADILRDLGFSVVICTRIVELGDLMALALPHLLVVDVMLPDGDGGDITELLRTPGRASRSCSSRPPAVNGWPSWRRPGRSWPSHSTSRRSARRAGRRRGAASAAVGLLAAAARPLPGGVRAGDHHHAAPPVPRLALEAIAMLDAHAMPTAWRSPGSRPWPTARSSAAAPRPSRPVTGARR